MDREGGFRLNALIVLKVAAVPQDVATAVVAAEASVQDREGGKNLGSVFAFSP